MIPKLCLILLLANLAYSYKILVYNVRYGHSQSNFLGRIADILVEEGHDVTSLIPIVNPSAPDGTTKSQIIHVPQSEATAQFIAASRGSSRDDFWERPLTDLLGSFALGRKMEGMFCGQCEGTLNHPGLIDRLKAEKFDVLINENFEFCGMGLAHAVAPKSSIIVSATTLFDNVAYDLGVPVMPSVNPSFISTDLDIHSIWSRFQNVLRTHTNNIIYEPALECANTIYRKKFGDDFPGIRELTARAAFAFTNSEPLIDFARPVLRKVVDIGGIGLKEPKDLDAEWKKVLALRPQTVLVSFGSMAKSVSMRPERKHAVLEALAQFPDVTFIWKYEAPEDIFAKEHIAKVKNVVIAEWIPQNDLLKDPRMTAFISHAGMASCQEAATHGVPGLYIPIFGDQLRNAAMMEYSGIGISISKFDAANSSKFTEAIRRLLETESLHASAKRTSAMLAKRPFSPRELLVKHVEFAAEFGPAAALTPRGIQLGWMQYFLVDIIFIVFVFSTLFLSLVSYASYRLFKICFWRSAKFKPQ